MLLAMHFSGFTWLFAFASFRNLFLRRIRNGVSWWIRFNWILKIARNPFHSPKTRDIVFRMNSNLMLWLEMQFNSERSGWRWATGGVLQCSDFKELVSATILFTHRLEILIAQAPQRIHHLESFVVNSRRRRRLIKESTNRLVYIWLKCTSSIAVDASESAAERMRHRRAANKY